MLFTGILYGWNYFGFRGGLSTSFYTDLQIQVLLNLAELLLIQLGLFFIFLGGLRLLPSVRPWSKVGPIFILVGALIIAGFDIVEVVLFYPQGGVTLPDWASYVIVATVLAGSVLMTLGLLVSLFAVVKGILLRTPAAPNVSHL